MAQARVAGHSCYSALSCYSATVSGPVQEPLGTVTDRVAKFETLALSSQAATAAADALAGHQEQQQRCGSSGARTPRGTLRGVLSSGQPYRLNRISEASERSQNTSIADSVFVDGEPGYGPNMAVLTPRSTCNSLVSVDSDCTDIDISVDEGVMHGVQNSVGTGDVMRKNMRVLVPNLQLKNLAFTMPSITEEALGISQLPEGYGSHMYAAEYDATPRAPLDAPNRAARTEADNGVNVHTGNMCSMRDAPVTSFQATCPSPCKNPFVDEQEPTSSTEVEQSIHAHACAIVASVHTPRSDLVFGTDLPTACASLPTTQQPTSCMSLMQQDGAVDVEASVSLPAEQPLTPLVDTITCSGYKHDPQSSESGNRKEKLKSGRCQHPTTFFAVFCLIPHLPDPALEHNCCHVRRAHSCYSVRHVQAVFSSSCSAHHVLIPYCHQCIRPTGPVAHFEAESSTTVHVPTAL